MMNFFNYYFKHFQIYIGSHHFLAIFYDLKKNVFYDLGKFVA